MTREEAEKLLEDMFAFGQSGNMSEYLVRHDRCIAALTAPPLHTDDVALVDALASESQDVGSADANYDRVRYADAIERQSEARTALLALLSQRRADRDAVIEECAASLVEKANHYDRQVHDELKRGDFYRDAAQHILTLKGA